MKKVMIVAAALLAPASAVANDALSAVISGPMNFVFYDQGKTIVTIHPDGTILLGEGVTVDEASRVFWKELQREGMRLACPTTPDAAK